MNEPTDKQIQWLWKQCGFDDLYGKGDWSYRVASFDWRYYGQKLPPIDLNNLFKHAVPKLEECHLITFRQNEYYAIAKLNGKVSDATNKDPALALFWAFFKALGGADGNN